MTAPAELDYSAESNRLVLVLKEVSFTHFIAWYPSANWFTNIPLGFLNKLAFS